MKILGKAISFAKIHLMKYSSTFLNCPQTFAFFSNISHTANKWSHRVLELMPKGFCVEHKSTRSFSKHRSWTDALLRHRSPESHWCSSLVFLPFSRSQPQLHHRGILLTGITWGSMFYLVWWNNVRLLLKKQFGSYGEKAALPSFTNVIPS